MVLVLSLLFCPKCYCLTQASETETELTLCKILQHTPNYRAYNLDQNSECLSHVKTYGDLICLRNGYNQVNYKTIQKQKLYFKWQTKQKNNIINN